MATHRWIVTYTKHMKQKRKVYQDGVLELCSSTGTPQVMLYDECEKLIDRRFLKKDEIIKSGGTLSFETHIVEIGDPDGSKIPSAESNVKPCIQPVSQKEKLFVEWNVLYTTQTTQKVKRYHDGVLRLPACSSHFNLITLLNEDGAVLSSKFLKSVAGLKSDVKVEFPNYLVQVCERRDSVANKDLNHSKKVTNNCSSKAGKFINTTAPLRDDFNHSKTVANNCSSKVGKFINTTAPLRDAWHILSVLKKPSLEGNLLLKVPLVEQDLTSQSTDKCQLDLQDKCQLDLQDKCGIAPLNAPLLNSVQPADDYHEELSAFSSEICGTSTRDGLKSADSQGPHVSANIQVLGADSHGSSSADDHSSSCWLSGIFTLETSQTISSPMNKPDKHITDIGFSEEVIHYMNPVVFLEKHLEDLNGEHQHCASASNHLKEKMFTDESSSLPGMDTKSILCYSAPSQRCTKFSKADARCETSSYTSALSSVHAASNAAKDPGILSSPELANMKDFPTFDLGF